MITTEEYKEALEDYFEDFTFKEVESSNIKFVSYNEDTKILLIAFKGGKIYAYPHIEPQKYQELIQADSTGKWVNSNLVKPKLEFKKYEITK